MEDSPENQMLDAFELFLYACRYHDAQLAVVLDPEVPLGRIVEDLRVLHLARIHCAVVCRSDAALPGLVNTLRKRGLAAEFIYWDAGAAERCRAVLERGRMPIAALDKERFPEAVDVVQQGLRIAREFDASRIFVAASQEGLVVEGEMKRIASLSDLIALRGKSERTNLGSRLLSCIEHQLSDFDREVVLFRGEPAALFQELFTHEGRGTLFTRHSPNLIRRAETADVLAIATLMKPYIRSGSIVPISEDEIAGTIERFYVHTVNSAIIAAARLVDYGSAAELGKFCTLPRYQRRGLANELAAHMIGEARAEGKERLFALSTSPGMWQFFQSLGFVEVPRDSLPEKWRSDYDFSRPSKALQLRLD